LELLMDLVPLISIAVTAAALAYAWHVGRAERLRSAARVASLAAAIEGHTDDTPAPMFARGAGSMVQSRPLLKVAIGFGMAVFIIVVVAMTGDRREAPAAAVDAPPRTAEALELLSMRHARDGESLTVTGLVRNPAPAAPGVIMAVVFAFDRSGGFVASGRAPLEFATIAAGDESPFRVTIPDVGDVGRYRVSFRTEDGVVRHVDRRPASAEAAGDSAGGRPTLQALTN
jgi:hypothetical protein